MNIYRQWAMSNPCTFSIKPIKELLKKEVLVGEIWADPFARDSKIATITNDLNPMCDTNYHLEALEFLKLLEDNSVEGVLYDPPYSPRQIKEVYDGIGIDLVPNEVCKSDWHSKMKLEISRIVKLNGKVISFGWNSGGVGKKYGFEIQTILLVPHGGAHNDTIIVVDKKIRQGDFF